MSTITLSEQTLESELAEVKRLASTSPEEALIRAELLVHRTRDGSVPFDLGMALALRAEAAHYLGRVDIVNESMQGMEEVRETLDDPAERARITRILGARYFGRGNFVLAHERLLDALTLFEQVGDDVGTGEALCYLGELYNQTSDFEQALACLFRAYDIMSGRNLPSKLANILNFIGNTYVYLSRYDKAEEEYLRSLEQYRHAGDRVGEAYALGNLGLVCKGVDRFEEALDYYGRSLAIWREIGNAISISYSTLEIALVHLFSGELEQAYDATMEAIALVEGIDDVPHYARILTTRAQVLSGLGRLEEALAVHTEAYELFERLGRKKMMADSLRSVAEHQALLGRHAVASELFLKWAQQWEDILGAERRDALERADTKHAIAIAAKEREILQLRAERAEQESEARARELNASVLSLINRNEALKALQDMVTPYSRDGKGMTKRLASDVLEGIRQAVGTHGEWQLFNEQFERIHRDFVVRLHERAPSLTPTEIRICILIRLNLSTKQIGDLLFTAPVTVKSHRQSVRRKLGFDADDNLTSYLMSL